MLIRLCYASEIARPISTLDVQILLGQAQVRNRRLDVTGALTQSCDHFVQVLEGDRRAVDVVMDSIGADPRHRLVRIIFDEPAGKRIFSTWSMALICRDDLSEEMRRLHCHGASRGWDTRRICGTFTRLHDFSPLQSLLPVHPRLIQGATCS